MSQSRANARNSYHYADMRTGWMANNEPNCTMYNQPKNEASVVVSLYI